jgi:hypothetical protein
VGELSDDDLREIWETGHLPTDEQLASDDGEQDLQFLLTSAYYRWLDENPDAMKEHENKCIRAVFNAGRRYAHHSPDATKMVSQPAPPAAEALAARPLLEEVARLGDVIDRATVGRIIVLSSRAAAWLQHNPPGQPIAIEPRGCPAPGACGCVVPAPQPAAGEVGELIEGLKLISDGMDAMGHESDSWFVARAADLLEQRHPAPVPVSERLPGPEDCDGEGRCWVHQPHEACPESPAWELMLAKYASPNYGATCWLPANALPLPAWEVQP